MKRLLLLTVAFAMLAVLSTTAAYAVYPTNWWFAQDDALLDFSGTPGNPGGAGATFTVTAGTLAQYNDASSVLANFVISGNWAGVVSTPTEWVTTYSSTINITGINAYAGSIWTGTGNIVTRVQKTSVVSGNPLLPDTYLTSSLGLPVPTNGSGLQPEYRSFGYGNFSATAASGNFVGITDFVAPWLGTYNWRYDFDNAGLPIKQHSNAQGQLSAVPEPMSIMLGIMGLGSLAGFRKLQRK